MEIKSDKSRIAGIVEFNKHDIETSNYCGHFTVEGLQEFIHLLEKYHKPYEMVVLRVRYNSPDFDDGSGGCYMLVAAPDGKTEMVALQGCAHGKDGTED